MLLWWLQLLVPWSELTCRAKKKGVSCLPVCLWLIFLASTLSVSWLQVWVKPLAQFHMRDIPRFRFQWKETLKMSQSLCYRKRRWWSCWSAQKSLTSWGLRLAVYTPNYYRWTKGEEPQLRHRSRVGVFKSPSAGSTTVFVTRTKRMVRREPSFFPTFAVCCCCE